MSTHTKFFSAVSFSCLIPFLVNCSSGSGSDSGGNPSGTPQGFIITDFTPDDGDEVGINSNVAVTFSQDVDLTSLNAYTFHILEVDSRVIVEGRITYDSNTRTVTFDPYTPLPYDTEYEVTVTDLVRNTSGSHIHQESFNFSTVFHPTETTFSPADGATNINTRTQIRIQFGHGIDWNSVVESGASQSVKLYNGTKTALGALVQTELEYDEDTNTIILFIADTAFLEDDTNYVYEISSSVQNLSGSPLYPSGLRNQFTTSTTSADITFTNTVASNYDDYAYALGQVDNGNVLITAGETWGVAGFNDIEHYDGDAFLAAFDADTGEVLDVLQFGSGDYTDVDASSLDVIYDLVTDGNNIYVTGYTEGNLDGLPGTGSPNGRRLFVARYAWNPQLNGGDGGFTTSNSNVARAQWIKTFNAGNDSYLEGIGIQADSTSLYIAARTSGTVTGNTNKGGFDIALFKVSKANGNLDWAEQFGTAADDYAKDIDLSGATIYIAGDTLGDFATPNHAHVGLNPFLLKVDVTSRAMTAFNMQTNAANVHDRTVAGIAVADGNIYVAGTLRNAGGTGTYVMTIDDSTNGPASAEAFVGATTRNNDERATAIGVSSGGSVYVAMTNFHEMSPGVMHGMTNIMSLNATGSQLNPVKILEAAVHTRTDAMLIDSTTNDIYVAGFVYGDIDGITELGMGDGFIGAIKN